MEETLLFRNLKNRNNFSIFTGNVIYTNPQDEEYYEQFVKAWRVRNEESLDNEDLVVRTV